ncbi:hypothetical protein [Ornithinimicrobium flavum]|uniref:hypothetical protein n=1 Tax=Ornithinimicrobium flavum TaxID=1288636 RepID=UPI001EE96E59|nr:hypothetical protein [Ornithinimicrobium flavum]
MTDPQLALASDIAIWAGLAVLALALISFSAHLAVTGAARQGRSDDTVPQPTALLVRTGTGTEGSTTFPDAAPTSAALEPPAVDHPAGVTRRWGVLGMQLTWLATFAVLAGTLMRGLSVQRWPLGNMYEFAIVAASFALVVFCTWSLKQDRLWLGPFSGSAPSWCCPSWWCSSQARSGTPRPPS